MLMYSRKKRWKPIQHVGSSNGAAIACASGDIAILCLAYDDGGVIPALPAGWTDLVSGRWGSTSGNSVRIVYKNIPGTSISFTGGNTYTLARSLHVYRGVKSVSVGQNPTASVGSFVYNALAGLGGTKWVLTVGVSRLYENGLYNSNLGNGYVTRVSVLNGAANIIVKDTNGPKTSVAAASVSGAGWCGAVSVILA